MAMSSTDTPFNSYWLVTLPGIMVFTCVDALLAFAEGPTNSSSSGCWTVFALTIARLFPAKHPARRWSFVLVIYFALSNLACIAVTIGTCQVKSGLLDQGELQGCIKGLGGFFVRNTFLFCGAFVLDWLYLVNFIPDIRLRKSGEQRYKIGRAHV